jgi:hypothetical protein
MAIICQPTGCDWAMYRRTDGTIRPLCGTNQGKCMPAIFATGSLTDFHNEALRDATLKLIQAIGEIPADSQGRTPSLVPTSKGLRLIWVHHAQTPPSDAVKISDEAEIERLLGIVD